MSEIDLTKNLLWAILNGSPIGMLLVNHKGEINFSNAKADNLLAYPVGALLGTSIDQFIPTRYRESHRELMIHFRSTPDQRAMGGGRILPMLNGNGVEIQAELGLSPLSVDGQEFVLVSLLETSNPILKVGANNDSLTGLPNRHLFQKISQNLLSLAIRNGASIALLFIDIDNFKNINDKHGHNFGDQVLCQIANILKKCGRRNDVSGRIGGDEFLVCLYGVNTIGGVETIAQKLIANISSISDINSIAVKIGVSIGAIFSSQPSDSSSIDDLINMADQLMYKAKNSGKGKATSKSI